uniref:non-specific serine/threonine protein kinase n=1 Tax=Leersia perrieri TaxID=77586 RepID=A0A0D9VP52_9ORYZ
MMGCFGCFLPEVDDDLKPSKPNYHSSDESSGPDARRKVAPLASDGGNGYAHSFTFKDLSVATGYFNEANFIGEGGFGKVYKGKINGQMVAVKQLTQDGVQGRNEFLVEVLMLTVLNHPHLVSLVGFCAQGDERLLSRPFLHDKRKFHRLADPALHGCYPTSALNQLVVISIMCLQDQPHVRPIISDVVIGLNHVASQPYVPERSSVSLSSPARCGSPQYAGTPSRRRAVPMEGLTACDEDYDVLIEDLTEMEEKRAAKEKVPVDGPILEELAAVREASVVNSPSRHSKRRNKYKKFDRSIDMGNCFCCPDAAAADEKTPPATSTSTTGTMTTTTSMSTATTVSGGGGGGGGDQTGMVLEAARLRVFTLAELRSVTRGFKAEMVLGAGGFGTVYKGWADERTLNPAKSSAGVVVAVKKLNPESVQGLHEWQSEVNFLGRLVHPNLVKLLGYCREERELLLVYEFMPKGSLENHLFRKGSLDPLSWSLRLKIAIGAARGLAFLHSSEREIIYRDFKASNILLDVDYTPKLSDFGLAKNGPGAGKSHVTTRVIGTYGYAAPEYVATGHLYVKSDVYCFGVVLLELLTGLRAHDHNRPSHQHNLVEWARPYITSGKKLTSLMDQRLAGDYPPKAALRAARLADRCLSGDPKSRPSMDDVVAALQEIEAIGTARPPPAKAGGRSPHRNPYYSKP